ncbi:MAG TPA: MFS transporter [Acidimicrobiales bacterium]|nr:MFS transporter [Acidimicrobiales bacterium]
MGELAFTRRQRLTLLATSIGLFMIYLDATIVNVALPDIQSEFNAGEQGLQWVVAAYSLTMGMFIMSAATLSDQRGRRRAFLGGMVLFATASAICGAAPSLGVLNLGRGLQGVGAATVNVASLALVSAAFPNPKRKARAIGIWTGIASVGLAIGPTVGGFLTETVGWRSIFFVNVAIGAIGVVLVRAFVDESRDPTPRSLDPAGQLLFIAAIGTLTYALIEGPHTGWRSPLIVGLLVGAGALIVAFVMVELRSPDPMMDVRVFGDRVYTVAIITLFTVLFCAYGLLLVITQYLQNVKDYSPERAGIVMLAFTLPLIVLPPIAGSLAARDGGRRPTLAGMAFLVVGLLVVIAGVGRPLIIVILGLLLISAAGGLTLSPTTNIAMSSIPPDRAGMASGIMSAQRALGSTAGFAIMGSVLAAVVASVLPGKFEPYLPEPARTEAVQAVVDDANPRALVSLIGPGKPLPETVAQRRELVAAADDAFADGIRAALLVGLVLAVLVLILGDRVFPRRLDEERSRIAEKRDLAVSEAVPQTPG